jgi:hypothetical protein
MEPPVTLSRRNLLTSLGLALPGVVVAAAEASAATKKKPVVKHPTHVAHTTKKPAHPMHPATKKPMPPKA